MEKFISPEGHRCSWSSGIHEGLTVGTGKIDEHGYWEHGCYECARAHEAQFPEDGEIWPFSEETLERMEKRRLWE